MTQPILLYPAAIGSGPIVYDAYDKWSTIALQAFALAQDMASQITNLHVSPVAFNAHFDPQIALTAFPTMAKPVVPAGLNFNAPALPPAPPTNTVPTLPDLTYVSQLFDSMKTAITTLLGGNALPAAVASAIRNRAYSAANAEEWRAVAQAYDEFAARGFEEPAGQLSRRITEARNDARGKRQLINRDVFIQEQMTAIENLRFAVTSGIQLETLGVTVFRTKADVALEGVRIAAETNRLTLDGWRAKVELYDTTMRGELARMDAVLKEFQAGVAVYQADAAVATAAGEFDNRRFQLNLAQEQAIVDTEMKRADQGFEQMRFITSVMLEVKKTLASVSAQLASAAMSAVNIGASMSSSTSESVGYGLDVKYSGQMKPDV
jgi:hypothetical protein